MSKGLESSISTNDNLLQDLSSNQHIQNNILGILRSIESIIPEDSRENFYTNLQTLRVNFDDMLQSETIAMGAYSKKTNTIILDNSILSATNQLDEQQLMAIYHELLHMASATRDEKTGYFASGFQRVEQDENGEVLYEEELEGMTEGFTELLAAQAFGKRTYESMSTYGKQMNFTEHLALLSGMEEMKRAYFNNRNGMTEIDRGLKKIDVTTSPAELYQSIEQDYRLSYDHNSEQQPGLVAGIEQQLLHLSSEKAKTLIDEKPDITVEELSGYWQKVAGTINFSEKLELMGEDPKKHEGVEQLRPLFTQYRQQSIAERNKRISTKDVENAHAQGMVSAVASEERVKRSIGLDEIEKATAGVPTSSIEDNELSLAKAREARKIAMEKE